MFIKNNSKKDIKLNSFEGYRFSAPPGVSAIWDSAGAELLEKHSVKGEHGKVTHRDNAVHFTPQNPPLLSIVESTEAEWEKGGKKYVAVSRYIVDAKQIPRANLITVAQHRGVSAELITKFLSDPNIDATEIASAINELPIPDDIRYPGLKQNEEK